MARTTRSTNLDLIRWLNYGHEKTAEKLAGLTNANYLSKMATGDMAIGDHEAREIERILTLPVGWMDRDNTAMLAMTPTEFELYQLVKQYPDETKVALVGFLASMKAQQTVGVAASARDSDA